MGTSAVYVTLSGLKDRPQFIIDFEHFFFFLNLAVFVLNLSTLILQACRELTPRRHIP
jgi:hypothetical protein